MKSDECDESFERRFQAMKFEKTSVWMTTIVANSSDLDTNHIISYKSH